MSISIKEVLTQKDLKKFIRFYNELYVKNKFIAFPLEFDELSTLSKTKNPAHKFCDSKYWLAYENGKIVGRIAAIINLQETNNTGRFGFYDFIDNEKVSHALMTTAVNWLKENAIETLHGPFGFTDLDRQGMLIEGFDKPGTMATLYNYPYYQQHIESLNFTKSTDWVEYLFDIKSEVPSKIQKISKFVQQKNNIKPLDIKKKSTLKKYIPEMFDLINATYKDLYGYTFLNKEQIAYYGKNYFGFVKKKLVSLIVNHEGKLIGVGLTMPSFTKALQKSNGKLFPFGWYHILKALNKNETLDLYLVAVAPEYQDKGINAVMIDELYRASYEFGIKQVETNIELEDNNKVQSMWKYFDAEQHKRRRCYIKNI